MSKKVIKFGKWQDKPIEWIVLEKDNFQMLVISKTTITSLSINTSAWKNCGCRNWLNNDFFNQAFSTLEKTKIVNTYLPDSNCKDNVFNLSKPEVEKYMTDNERLINGSCYSWYTRTAYHTSYASYMYYVDGSNFNYHNNGRYIRPAMYLLSDLYDDIR